MSKELLAKSNPPLSLRQHILDGLKVWAQLRVAFPQAPQLAKLDRFWDLLRLSVITHDLGKGHSEFQKVLEGIEKNEWHKQRHELFSLPFVQALRLDKAEKVMVLRVVAGHHRSYTWLRDCIKANYELDPEEYNREFSKVDVKSCLKLAEEFDGVAFEALLPRLPLDLIKKYLAEVRTEKITDHFSLLLLVGAFKHCDHLSSAFITQFEHLADRSFASLDRLRKELSSNGLDLYFHQRQAALARGHVILTAPTGSGKTESALLWLRNQLNQTGQGRTFYVLPFTASINAMYERLRNPKKGLGEKCVGLLHGKLDAYLYYTFQEAGRIDQRKEYIKKAKEQFQTLQTPVKVLTPFQLLKHIFGLSGFEKGIFEWVGGHFIFDEIHAYEPEVIAQIVVLLEFVSRQIGAKVFIMTATMPAFLKKMIIEAIGQPILVQAEEQLYQEFRRHRIEFREGLLSNNLFLIQKSLDEGKKVLVVCNTVDQAQAVYANLSSEVDDSLLLHGRFAAKDRTRIEKELQNEAPRLLVGTQAIEISLDIDYDIIFSEPAPLDALIQRFGRVNRERKKGICPCVVFTGRNSTDKYIYPEEIVQRTLNALKKMASDSGGEIKEEELQRYLDEIYPSFDKASQSAYDRVYYGLKNHLKRLFPFEPSKEQEEEYYRQFDGVPVLPAIYEKEFKSRLNELDFIGAEQLKVQIPKRRYSQLHADAKLEKKLYDFQHPDESKSKIIRIDYLKVNLKYNPKTGLNYREEEHVSDIESQFSFGG